MSAFYWHWFAFADVPQIISYQGLLSDSKTGEALNGNHDITFRIYNVETGGVAIWQEVHPAVPLENGLFSVMLGSISPFAPFVDFSEQYWLKVAFDGTVMEPRYKLASSPYALNIADDAVTSEKINDGSVTQSDIHSRVVFAEIRDSAGVPIFALTNRRPELQIVGKGSAKVEFDADAQRVTIDVPESENGKVEYWQRVSTVLSPYNANDKVEVEVNRTASFAIYGVNNATASATGDRGGVMGGYIASGTPSAYGYLGFNASSGTPLIAGVYGKYVGPGSERFGVYGENNSSASDAAAYGVYGIASASIGSPTNYGVYGKAATAGATDYGVYGNASGTGGVNSRIGVVGLSGATSVSPTTVNAGVAGFSNGDDFSIYAYHASSLSDNEVLVVSSATSPAGIKFFVDSDGDVSAKGNIIFDRTNDGTLTTASLAANRTWTLPDESGTIMLTSSMPDSLDFIENQFAKAQSPANFWIAGNGKIDSTLFVGGKLGIGTASPQTELDVNGNVFISNEHRLFMTDSSGADTFSIWDDGDTTHIRSDNIMAFGDSTFFIDPSGYQVIAHNCDLYVMGTPAGSGFGNLIVGGTGGVGQVYLWNGIYDDGPGGTGFGNAGEVLVTAGSSVRDVYWANASEVAHGPNCAHWTRGTGDDVNIVFTGDCTEEFLGIAKGDCGNDLYGDYDSTHVNLGISSQTGLSGMHYKYCTVSGGVSNNAYMDYATIGGGMNNSANESGTVSGGMNNFASGKYSTVGGGSTNKAITEGSTIGGGVNNMINGGHEYGTIAGGVNNSILSSYASIGGGFFNYIEGNYGTIGGGYADTVIADYGGVFSGDSNTVGDEPEDTAAFVGGGWNNSAIAKCAIVGGGRGNIAYSEYASICGGYSNFIDDYGFIGGGQGNHTECRGLYNTIGGGLNNYLTCCTEFPQYNFIGGGSLNHLSAQFNAIGGGFNNAIGGRFCNAISGGQENAIELPADYSAISGGYRDTITEAYSGILGGQQNRVDAPHSSILGGQLNKIAIGVDHSSILGGSGNIVNASYSIAFGYNVTVDESAVAAFFGPEMPGKVKIADILNLKPRDSAPPSPEIGDIYLDNTTTPRKVKICTDDSPTEWKILQYE